MVRSSFSGGGRKNSLFQTATHGIQFDSHRRGPHRSTEQKGCIPKTRTDHIHFHERGGYMRMREFTRTSTSALVASLHCCSVPTCEHPMCAQFFSSAVKVEMQSRTNCPQEARRQALQAAICRSHASEASIGFLSRRENPHGQFELPNFLIPQLPNSW